MTFPRNEKETIALYEIIQNRIGWQIVESQSNAFPDAILESDEGERLACEFEHLAKNFKKHGHPVDDSCDLIICWQDNWPDAPLPVMALEDCAGEEAEIIRMLLSGSVSRSDHVYLKNENQALQRKLAKAEEILETMTGQYEWIEEDLEYFLGNVYEEIMFELALKEIERQHGLPDHTLKHKYDWLPRCAIETHKNAGETIQQSGPQKTNLWSKVEQVIAAIILIVIVPIIVVWITTAK